MENKSNWWIAPMFFGGCLLWLLLLSKIAFGDVIIKNDLGGSIEQRMASIDKLRASGEVVKIKGVCASSCTMLLALKKTCVTPSATLMFHGPSSQFYGVGLSPKEFEKWSNVMASYYPEPIKSYFLNDWRYTTVGVTKVSGKKAIDMGIPKC